MNKLVRKFISVFFLAVFFFASGTGQLVHAAFHDHDHNYTAQTDKGSSVLTQARTYCIALQLMLPEFFQSGNPVLQSIPVFKDRLFATIEPDIVHLFSFRNSDRAPPVLA